MSAPPVLEATGVRRSIRSMTVLDGVDVAVGGGEVVAVLGPNGAGKSTLLDCLSGAQRPDGGHVRLGGAEVTGAPPDERARRGLARTFQHSSLFATLTVEDNLRVAAEATGGQGRRRRCAGEQRIAAVVADLGLAPVRSTLAGRLPTGARRTVELARALCTAPAVLLLDEPASGLTAPEVEALATTLRALRARHLAVVVVEHDLELVAAVADRAVVLTEGRVVASGPVAEVLAAGLVRTALLGEGER